MFPVIIPSCLVDFDRSGFHKNNLHWSELSRLCRLVDILQARPLPAGPFSGQGLGAGDIADQVQQGGKQIHGRSHQLSVWRPAEHNAV